jgi:Flp pilus assembly pilin Flp
MTRTKCFGTRAPAQRRLLDDERGLGTIEFVVLLVLVLALAVSVWNLFGNGIACAFSSAVESFDGSKRPEAKCGEPTAGATPPGGRHGSAAGRASSASGGQPASQPLSAQQPAVAGSAPVAPTSPSSSSTTSSEATEPTLTETLTNGLATFGEHVLDFTEGIIAGANPLTPVVPVELRPTFGHQVTYGAGQIVGSVVGLLEDAGNIIAGGTGVVASGALIVASDGTLVWVALPAMAGSGALASAGVAAAAGHGANFMEGIDNVLHGENQGSGSTSEKPPGNEKPQAKEKSKPGRTESGYPRDSSAPEGQSGIIEQPGSSARSSSAAAAGTGQPARQIEAAWGASKYRHGGQMTGMEHIMYRHSANSGFANVSRFANGTTARNVIGYVDDALRSGTVVKTGPTAFTIEYNTRQTIGTNIAGEAASSIRVFVKNGVIQTAFPF